MIERICDQTVHVRPLLSIDRNARPHAVTVDNSVGKTADYLYDPQFYDKLNASRHSINEELILLSELNRKSATAERHDQQQESASTAASIETLKRSLLRIESLLYQVASVTAADPDSMQVLQRKLADEIRGYETVVASVDLPESSDADFTLRKIAISDETGSVQIGQFRISEALEEVESAQSTADRFLVQFDQTERRDESRTEAALSTADQNMAAAQSTVYPDEILARAKQVAERLREGTLDTPHLKRTLKPEEVLGLIDTGQ